MRENGSNNARDAHAGSPGPDCAGGARRVVLAMPDDELYRRGAETLVASWEAYARGSRGAAVVRAPGVAAAVFPLEPGRGVYNNALIDRGLPAPARAAALQAMEDAYAFAGVARFAAWVHEGDAPLR